jgi:hypothetical protein
MTDAEQHRQAIYYLEQKREQLIQNNNDLKVKNFLNHGNDVGALNASYLDISDINATIKEAKARFRAAADAELSAADCAAAAQACSMTGGSPFMASRMTMCWWSRARRGNSTRYLING